MESHRTEEMRAELNELLRKQHQVLESRMSGTASDSELLEYEIRQEVVAQLCDALSRSDAA
jgi:hypothetical protein